MTKENDVTSIRIPKSVKEDLKNIALTKEPYHATIQRLIRENKSLKEDKECLMKILMETEDSTNMKR